MSRIAADRGRTRDRFQRPLTRPRPSADTKYEPVAEGSGALGKINFSSGQSTEGTYTGREEIKLERFV